jgi:protein involved in polysaccharide export with SLBB domain
VEKAMASKTYRCQRALLSLLLALSASVASTILAQSQSVEALDRPIERSDLIIIEVFGERDLSVERRVQAGGTIRYPLLGDIDVAGKTTTELSRLLTKRLGEDYLVNPEVEVTVKQYRSRTVAVIGKVLKPGPVLLPEEERMDIIQAISFAGGFSPNANENRILHTRKGKTTTYSMKEIKAISDDEKRVWLEPGDVIEIREAFF